LNELSSLLAHIRYLFCSLGPAKSINNATAYDVARPSSAFPTGWLTFVGGEIIIANDFECAVSRKSPGIAHLCAALIGMLTHFLNALTIMALSSNASNLFI
jgi:hypothetical protein